MKKTFQVLNEMVRDGVIENYAIAGAIGATFYVEPFATQDIDALVMMPETKGGLITEIPGWEYLQKRGYTEIRDESIVVAGWPLQFIPVSDALEKEAYLNADVFSVEETTVRVVLAEHLVAIMLKLGRAKDVARIEMFLSQDAVDRETLLDIIKRHGLEEKLGRFKSSFQ